MTCDLDNLTYFTTPTGQRYAELSSLDADTGSYDASADDINGSRSFYLPTYSDSSGFVEFMLGIKFSKNGIAPNNGPRRFHPNAPMVAKKVNVTGVGKPEGNYEEASYPKGAIAEVSYGRIEYNLPEDKESGGDPSNPQDTENISISADFGTQSFMLPKEGIEGEGGVKLNEADDRFAFIYPVGTITITRHNVIDFGVSDYIGELGKVNLNVLGGFPIGHLMFTGVSTNITISELGAVTQDVGYGFGYRGIGAQDGWKKIWQTKRTAPAQDAGWRVARKIGGAPLYESSSFASILPELQ